MDDRIFVLDLLLVKLESAVCNIGSTKNSSKVNDTFSGLTNYRFPPFILWRHSLNGLVLLRVSISIKLITSHTKEGLKYFYFCELLI